MFAPTMAIDFQMLDLKKKAQRKLSLFLTFGLWNYIMPPIPPMPPMPPAPAEAASDSSFFGASTSM